MARLFPVVPLISLVQSLSQPILAICDRYSISPSYSLSTQSIETASIGRLIPTVPACSPSFTGSCQPICATCAVTDISGSWETDSFSIFSSVSVSISMPSCSVLSTIISTGSASSAYTCTVEKPIMPKNTAEIVNDHAFGLKFIITPHPFYLIGIITYYCAIKYNPFRLCSKSLMN